MKTIDAQTLSDWLAAGKPVSVLDVRSQADRDEWWIPGSTHVNVYEALKHGDTTALSALNLPDDVPVVTVCGRGYVAGIAAQQLEARGLNAYALEDGMRAWSLAWNSAEVVLPHTGTRIIQVRRTGKGCLSYIIGSGSDAIVVDASLPVEVYIQLAREHGWKIKSAMDTHIHADHISRSYALTQHTGATLFMPDQQRLKFPHATLSAGDSIKFGSAKLSPVHTPGHTQESMSYLLDNAALFTGDTLFLAAVGRPDLHASFEAARDRAQLLHASLQKILKMDRSTLIFPGHTNTPAPFDQQIIAESLAVVTERTALLHSADRDAFANALLARIPAVPANHSAIIEINENGWPNESQDISMDLEAGANRCAIS